MTLGLISLCAAAIGFVAFETGWTVLAVPALLIALAAGGGSALGLMRRARKQLHERRALESYPLVYRVKDEG